MIDIIKKVKAISVWIFIVPFVAINTCLIIITHFHGLFPVPESIIHWTFPYVDGGASISRTVRPYPTWLIFKPAMFLTSFLLIKYWIYNAEIIKLCNVNNKNINKFLYFGIASAVALTIHSIFLGIKFDNDFYKLFRRIIMLLFIIFEITAQAYLVKTLYSFKDKLDKYINRIYLKGKIILVITLIIVGIISVPIISWPGDKFKFVKHALEWDYFLGVIIFYLLTFLMWKNKSK
tara:strand:+ start:408 stop:1109 length:702 start_codon:yes stop_codon:yes gene_type:complete